MTSQVSVYDIASVIVQTTQHDGFAVTKFRLVDSKNNALMEVRVFGPNENERAASIEILPSICRREGTK